MRFLLTCMCFAFFIKAKSQELFVYTEPASNMAAKGIGLRATNTFMKEDGTGNVDYYLIPEVMVGVSKHLMVHAEMFLSNRNNSLVAEGGGVYLKYRFYSQDDVHSHFRMAAYTRASFNNSEIQQPALNLNGLNSGIETGLIATKLMNKVALSTGVGYLYAADNGNGNKLMYGDKYRNNLMYNISLGRLMLPKEYTSYRQTNVNLMLELLGQTQLHGGASLLDIAPSIQFIILSKMRIDIGYRFAIVDNLYRTATNSGLIRFEYNFFNVF